MGQHAVNIVYPIHGETYPKVDGGCRINSAYFAVSFSVTCSGDHTVKWGFDGNGIAEAPFYDEISIQFVWKLATGSHTFFVSSDCGENEVKFEIG